MKWGSDDDVKAYHWAEKGVWDEMDPDPDDQFAAERYDARVQDLRAAETRVHWLQRRTFYTNHKSRKW